MGQRIVELDHQDFYGMRSASALGCTQCPHQDQCQANPLQNTPEACHRVTVDLKQIWDAQHDKDFSKLKKLQGKLDV